MTIVITGANRGIGQALFNRYNDLGHKVIGTHRAPTHGAMHQLEVTDPASHAAFADGLGDSSVDLLICNAGIYEDKGQSLVDGYPASMWAHGFATNVTGVFLSFQTLLPHLRRAETPKIAIISSQMASDTRAPGGSYIYRASKAAALNLGRNLASDLKAEGIAVGIYHPGWVQTDMGTQSAEITTAESAEGLMARFAALDLASTGCFETWDGRTHPY
ncbi:NADP-dependent 3-hydroxy acid dehydrogenase YdfG [Yoonia maricola]|uniref:NADP-dependent 3-hydroxy acid dehydrogenase YdfG n=1 Tax=Yoonia maricola TaxID=420999 RepID=A0A2M8WP73_9RHOB|nr:SDR family NAD(P)-dependent oxidoreductase [Yoonia maricola]PJI92735.1 NADP-dependent 3-hydroxy acid dehydrogenase YdfG [Yoonia maricola]